MNISSSLSGASEVGPINIRAHGFARNTAIGCLLNLWATIRRNWPMAGFPLRNQRRSHIEGFGQRFHCAAPRKVFG